VITRLGLNEKIKKEKLIECMKNFGKNDDVYECCNVFEINQMDGWIIYPGVQFFLTIFLFFFFFNNLFFKRYHMLLDHIAQLKSNLRKKKKKKKK
jgi:hypothetical protein